MESAYARLVKLKDDPEAFNAEANVIFEDFILGVPEERRQRLRAMHWKIQQDLRHYTDPVARLNKFIEIFYEEYFRLAGELQEKTEAILRGEFPQWQPSDSTNIVAFEKPEA